MWRILAILLVGSCYSSAERVTLTIAALPANVTASAPPPVFNVTERGDSRIIGGFPATIEAHPYAVQVLQNNQLACGGTLITRRHVLSAAHCFVDARGVLLSTSIFSCRVGSATLHTGGVVRGVSMIINHEWYNYGYARDNDISVLLLASTVTLSSTVSAIIIPSQGSMVANHATVGIIGWGRTNVGVNQPSTLLNEVSVYAINQTICTQRYRELELIRNEPFPVTTNMMCTGVLDVGGRDACQGDSGGPVLYLGFVVGITSWGEGCALARYPGVNTRVSAYTNWINATVTRYNGAPSLGQTSAMLLLLSVLVSAVYGHSL